MRTTAALVLTGALTLVAAPAAHAETWHAQDARRDVTSLAYSPDPPPCGTSTDGTVPSDRRRDITRVAVDHGDEMVTVRLTLREIGRRHDDTGYALHLLVPGGAFLIDVFRDGQGGLEAFFSKDFTFPRSSRDDCGIHTSVGGGRRPCEDVTARADPRRDRIEVTVPRSCLRDPRWVKVGADATGGFSGSIEAGFVILSDEWSPSGVVSTGYPPPYGPRVRHG